MATTPDPASARIPSGHEDSVGSQAPGPLESVRSFLSLHDHEVGNDESFPPAPATVEGWLRSRGLIGPEERVGEPDLEWALNVQNALRALVHATAIGTTDRAAAGLLDEAAAEAGLRLRFGEAPSVRPQADGVRGAVGALLAVSFLAELDGSFRRLRECSAPDCTTVFFDRSRNRTAKWCSMAACGNRSKVRRFRERERERSRSRSAIGVGETTVHGAPSGEGRS